MLSREARNINFYRLLFDPTWAWTHDLHHSRRALQHHRCGSKLLRDVNEHERQHHLILTCLTMSFHYQNVYTNMYYFQTKVSVLKIEMKMFHTVVVFGTSRKLNKKNFCTTIPVLPIVSVKSMLAPVDSKNFMMSVWPSYNNKSCIYSWTEQISIISAD